MSEYCEGCFYRAWAPVAEQKECALKHPHEGDHIRCDYCWIRDKYNELATEYHAIKDDAHYFESRMYELEYDLENARNAA